MGYAKRIILQACRPWLSVLKKELQDCVICRKGGVLPMIEVKELTKVFRKPIRGEGLSGMVKTLFSRKYEEVRAVDGISFTVPDGEIVGYIGEIGRAHV